MRRVDACACYVRALGEEALFTLRYGAHVPSCPVYRPSADPVDQMKDEAIRARYAPQRGKYTREESLGILDQELRLLELRIAARMQELAPELLADAEGTASVAEMQQHLVDVARKTLDAWIEYETHLTVLQGAVLSVYALDGRLADTKAEMDRLERALAVTRRTTVALAAVASSVREAA